MSGAPRSPRRPNIPLPPHQKYPALFAFQRPPKRSPRKTPEKTPQGKYEQFLAPQTFDNMSSAAPLALNVLYPIGHTEEESEEEEIQNSDTNSLFERQRKVFLSKYFSQNDKVVVVNLKSERRKLFEPKYIDNNSYLRQMKDDSAMSAPLERRRTHTIGLEDSSSPRLGSTAAFSTYNDNNARTPRSKSLTGRTRRRSSTQSEEGMTDFEFNDSWIDAISMDIDEDVPVFLSTLPDVPAKKVRKETPAPPPEEEEELLSDDPVEEALKTALSKQANTVEFATDPAPDLPIERTPKKRQPSAAELTREWGFVDPSIGRCIATYIRQIEGEDKHRK